MIRYQYTLKSKTQCFYSKSNYVFKAPQSLAKRTTQRFNQKRFSFNKTTFKSLLGPFNVVGLGLVVLTAGGLYYTLKTKQKQLQSNLDAKKKAFNQSVGKPLIGGPFNFIDHNGNKVTENDLKGKYSLIYFGFTHCPDICPDELDKITELSKLITPYFVSCDPYRDTPEIMKQYLQDFHPAFVGLTTDNIQEVVKATKAFRVYYSMPPDLKKDEDYIVDHSIFFYLMDKDYKFVDYYGKDTNAEQCAKSILSHLSHETTDK